MKQLVPRGAGEGAALEPAPVLSGRCVGLEPGLGRLFGLWYGDAHTVNKSICPGSYIALLPKYLLPE